MGLTVIMNHIYVYRLLYNIKSTERNYSLVQYTNKRIKSIYSLFQIETSLISFCGFEKLRYLCLLTICNEAECEAGSQQKKNIGGRKEGESEEMCGDWI